MYVQRATPMGRIRCMYKGPLLWGEDVCTKDESYGDGGPIVWGGHDACTGSQSYGDT